MNNKINAWQALNLIGGLFSIFFLVPSIILRVKHEDVRATKLRRIGLAFNVLAAIGQFGSAIQNRNADEKRI